ncbi:hypothetical protein Acr_00g0005410 [Actinidia rufa]|uniref:Retrotransposon Copia-like N-terminal domain-containing protein n=1 Tax=Actinidia rufa TaxID=165716 RepID=A0A7J0D7T2_9ERIC|nr:hypothetical protein Acr_00g0005410 [Actinidia rufa]
MAEPLSFNTMVHMITIKLSATNFLLWKSQILPLLQCQDCLGFIDGSLQKPFETLPNITDGTSIPNPKFLKWKLKDQRILSLLLSSLTEEAMAAAVGHATSRDVWDALERLCDQLMAIGRPVDEVDKSYWFLRALGTEFAAFKATRAPGRGGQFNSTESSAQLAETFQSVCSLSDSPLAQIEQDHKKGGGNGRRDGGLYVLE